MFNSNAGKKVLVIGSGRSASDVVIQISAVTHVTSVQHARPNETERARQVRLSEFGTYATFKDGIDHFQEDGYGVVFTDGTRDNFNVVIFATGNFLQFFWCLIIKFYLL